MTTTTILAQASVPLPAGKLQHLPHWISLLGLTFHNPVSQQAECCFSGDKSRRILHQLYRGALPNALRTKSLISLMIHPVASTVSFPILSPLLIELVPWPPFYSSNIHPQDLPVDGTTNCSLSLLSPLCGWLAHAFVSPQISLFRDAFPDITKNHLLCFLDCCLSLQQDNSPQETSSVLFSIPKTEDPINVG